MRKFIRVLTVIMGILLLVLLAGYAWLWIRQSNSGKQLVHPNSEAIVRVSVDKIMTGLLRNALANPREYWDTAKDTVETTQIWEAGVAIPANLYLFSLPEDTSSGYAVLHIKDKAKFQTYLNQRMDAVIEHTEDFLWFALTENGKFAVIGNDDHAVVSYSLRSGDRTPRLRELLSSLDELVSIESLHLSELSESRSSVTYWNSKNKNVCHLDFSAGKIDVKGSFSSELWRLSEVPLSRTMPSDNILTVWLDADVREALLYHRDFLSRYNVPVDSIQPYIGNYWEVQLREDSILQEDTIVTYDYNDNFELIEKKHVRSESVPRLSLSLKASPHLLSYLPERAFYRFNKFIDDDLVTLSTEQENIANRSSDRERPDSYCFYLFYRKGDGKHLIQDRIPSLGMLERMEMRGTRQNLHSLTYEGEILFEKKHIHPLKQIF